MKKIEKLLPDLNNVDLKGIVNVETSNDEGGCFSIEDIAKDNGVDIVEFIPLFIGYSGSNKKGELSFFCSNRSSYSSEKRNELQLTKFVVDKKLSELLKYFFELSIIIQSKNQENNNCIVVNTIKLK